MLSFTIRELLWLTRVICLVLGWGMWVRSLPPPDSTLNGNVYCAGAKLTNGQICVHDKSGLIYGSQMVDGMFAIPRIPEGDYLVAIEGEGIPAKYWAGSMLSVSIRRGRNQIDFDLASK